MRNTKIQLSLCIYSDVLLGDIITEKIGLTPDNAWNKGDKMIINGKWNGLIHKQNGWIKNSKLYNKGNVEENAISLLDELSPYIQKINKLKLNCRILFSYGIDYYNLDKPVLYFNNKILSKIYLMGADLDLDIY